MRRYESKVPVKVAVRCIESGSSFESLTEAAAYAGVSVQLIAHSCGEGVAAKGLHYERIDGVGRLCVKDRLRRNAAMRKDFADGMTVREIAAKYKLTYQATANVIKGADTDAKRKSESSERKRRDKRILKDHKKGLTYNQLAEKYGLSKQGIGLCLKRARDA